MRVPAQPLFWPALVGLGLTALLLHGYTRGGAAWGLGFVALLPALWLLDRCRSWRAALLAGYGLCLVYTAAGFAWFGFAIGRYTQIGPAAGLLLLLLLAPLFQPQILVFALLRHAVRQRHRWWLGALAGAAAWVGVEWLLPKVLGDSLGHGLYPSSWLRQGAALGGVAGLSVLLLLSNEALGAALARRRQGWRALAPALGLAVLPPLLLAAYGANALAGLRSVPTDAPMLRLGLIQANIVDIEARRRAQGSYAVVRELLDTHYAMSHDAIERQGADAVLWSETIYPTTFAQPRSEAGAELDREIVAIVNAAGVPFVFGTYDRDGEGEYNAAAFVEPGRGLLGFYRKTHLFPLTEFVPAWLDGPALRRWLPWLGGWQPGSGARVLPLRLRDGRELPVQALICRDDVMPGLAIAAARQGAQALLTMSNDSWFSAHPLGAELHQAVAAFRSIETRLPQFRVTSNGFSALIDAGGAVQAGAAMNERALVVGTLPAPVRAPTLMLRWGDWVGPTALGFVLLLGGVSAWPRGLGQLAPAVPPTVPLPLPVALLPPAARWTAALMRGLARAALLGLALALLLDEALRSQTLAQLRWFVALVLLPEAVAASLLRAYRAQLSLAPGRLLLQRGAQRLVLAASELRGVAPWPLPLPAAGATLQLADGARPGLAGIEPALLAGLLAEAGIAAAPATPSASAFAQARAAMQAWRLRRGGWLGRLYSPWARFVLLPLLLALPAFYLHQQIAYGSPLGEYLSYGLRAYLSAFALWWAAWAIGVSLWAGLLRGLIELGSGLSARLHPARATALRLALELAGLGLLYLGLPAWLLLRIAGA